MAKSSEYSDLPWMPPKSWTDANRNQVQLVVIHTTEGSATASAAEDGAAYDQRRTDGTSTHYFHDSDSTIQCVHTADQAHAARTQGNRRGIQHELCTRAGSANWGDAYHQAMLQRAAKQAARDAAKWDIPVKKLSSSQIAAGIKGFCGHVDITYAFPQDNGTHTDPGENFPWTQFLDMVRAEIGGDDMSTAEVIEGNAQYDKVATDTNGWKRNATGVSVWDDQFIPNPISGGKTSAYSLLRDLATQIMLIKKDVADLAGTDFVDEMAIVQGILAGLAGADGAAQTIADAVVAAIPPELATDVAQILLTKGGQALTAAGEALGTGQPNG